MRFKQFLKLTESEYFDEVKVGDIWTKTSPVCLNVGKTADWEKTYAELGSLARDCSYDVGTEVEVTAIAHHRTYKDPYVEFKTSDGKDFFLADDAFAINFFHGTLEEWHKTFLSDLRDD
jgi:hypothetical protein